MTRTLRPIPDDFAIQVNLLHNIRKIARHYSTGPRVVSRWLKETGIAIPRQAPALDPAPADLAENAARMSREALCNHYGIGKKRLFRWFAEAGVDVIASRNASGMAKEVPADFAKRAPTMHKMELKRYYKVAEKTLDRWFAMTGVSPKKYVPVSNLRPSRGNGQIIQFRAASVYELAADDLRRNGWIVSRRNAQKEFDAKGDFWLVGIVHCDGDELLARAERARRKAA